MKKLSAILLSLVLVFGSVLAVNASGYKDPNGFTFDADASGNLTILDYNGSFMNVPSQYLQMPIVKVKALAFRNNTQLETVSFENATNLTNIGTYAFAGCTSLRAINIPWSVSTVSTAAFKGCTAMTEAGYYSNSGKVSDECFSGCTELSSVTLGEDITALGNYAFGTCTSLTYLELSRAVTSISTTAFYNTPVTLGVYYGSYAYDYAKANGKDYVLLDGVKLGDANGDNSVSVNDVTAIQRYIAELEQLEGIYFKAADVNGDEKVDVNDATELQAYLAEFNVEYAIDEVMMS